MPFSQPVTKLILKNGIASVHHEFVRRRYPVHNFRRQHRRSGVAFDGAPLAEFGCRFLPTGTRAGNDASRAVPGCFRASTAAGIRLPVSAGSRPCRRRRQHRRSAGSSCSLLTRHTLPHLVTLTVRLTQRTGTVRCGGKQWGVRCGVVGSSGEPYGLVGARRFVFVTGGPFKVVTPYEAAGSGRKRPFHGRKRGGPG